MVEIDIKAATIDLRNVKVQGGRWMDEVWGVGGIEENKEIPEVGLVLK